MPPDELIAYAEEKLLMFQRMEVGMTNRRIQVGEAATMFFLAAQVEAGKLALMLAEAKDRR